MLACTCLYLLMEYLSGVLCALCSIGKNLWLAAFTLTRIAYTSTWLGLLPFSKAFWLLEHQMSLFGKSCIYALPCYRSTFYVNVSALYFSMQLLVAHAWMHLQMVMWPKIFQLCTTQKLPSAAIVDILSLTAPPFAAQRLVCGTGILLCAYVRAAPRVAWFVLCPPLPPQHISMQSWPTSSVSCPLRPVVFSLLSWHW